MALSPLFTVAIDSDRTEISITDVTVYGSPNLVRASTNVYFSAAKVSYENVETDVTTTGDDADPGTDSVWTYSYDEGDGYWKHRWAVIPDYAVGTTYAQYDAVNSGGVVYRSKSAGNVGQSVSSTVYWEVIGTPTDLADNKGEANESANIESYVYERVFTSNSQYAYGNLIFDNSITDDFDDATIMEEYDLFSLWLNGAITADERTIPLSGELVCRKIESRFID